jgi:alpha-ketoglutarate-dependent taurine dioxygenase
VQSHPATGRTILRFAEPVETELNPVSLAISGLEEQEGHELVAQLRERVYAPGLSYAHQWQRGDVLLADNHSLIHGRRAFERDCPRHLRRIQLI